MSSRKKYVLGKCIISWLRLHEGCVYSEMQEWVKYNLGVLESDLKAVLRILKKNKMLRTKSFKDVHSFRFYYTR